jgi:hypothetical protein
LADLTHPPRLVAGFCSKLRTMANSNSGGALFHGSLVAAACRRSPLRRCDYVGIADIQRCFYYWSSISVKKKLHTYPYYMYTYVCGCSQLRGYFWAPQLTDFIYPPARENPRAAFKNDEEFTERYDAQRNFLWPAAICPNLARATKHFAPIFMIQTRPARFYQSPPPCQEQWAYVILFIRIYPLI